MSMNISEKMPGEEASEAGTGMPHCIMYCKRATVFRQTDLPPALGPEMSRMRPREGSETSSGFISSPLLFRRAARRGW